MLEVEVFGLASGKQIDKFTTQQTSQQNFLEILQDRGITIASSCFGEGVCKRCLINRSQLSCQLSPADISSESFKIEVDYL